jgi:chromate transporter
MYLGWLKNGALGALLVAVSFILPSFLICVLLGIAYIHYGSLPFVVHIFYGMKAAVMAIMIKSTYSFSKRTISFGFLSLFLWLANALLVIFFQTSLFYAILLSGLLVLIVNTYPRKNEPINYCFAWPLFLVSGIHGPASIKTITDLGLYVLKAGALIFGSSLGIVPFLQGGVVNQFNWLSEQQFVDALAIALIIPGPMITSVAFIGYLVGGFFGSFSASLAAFLPCYLFTLVLAPYFNRYQNNKHVKAFVQGLISAAVGALSGAVYLMAKKTIIDLPTIIMTIIALILVSKTKVPFPIIILFFALLGLISAYR